MMSSFAFAQQPERVHGGLDVIPVLDFDLRPCALLAPSFRTDHALQLIVGKTEELLDASSRQQQVSSGNDLVPYGTTDFTFRKQEMQGRGISFACQANPLAQGVQSHVYIIGSISAIIPGRRPYVVRKRSQPEGDFRRFDIRTVDVQVVGALHLGPVQFRSTDKEMNQSLTIREAGRGNMIKQSRHALSETKTQIV